MRNYIQNDPFGDVYKMLMNVQAKKSNYFLLMELNLY